MDFLVLMNNLFALQRTFPGSEFRIETEGPDGNSNIVATLPISDTNAELYRQGQEMFKPQS